MVRPFRSLRVIRKPPSARGRGCRYTRPTAPRPLVDGTRLIQARSTTHEAHPDAPRPRDVRHLLLAIVVVLLTGFPQLVLAVSDGVTADEEHQLRPVRRVLLLDRAVGKRASPMPTLLPAGPGISVHEATVSARQLRLDRGSFAARTSRPRPKRWLRDLLSVLHRHHTNYV